MVMNYEFMEMMILHVPNGKVVLILGIHQAVSGTVGYMG